MLYRLFCRAVAHLSHSVKRFIKRIPRKIKKNIEPRLQKNNPRIVPPGIKHKPACVVTEAS